MANISQELNPDQVFQDWLFKFASEHNYQITQAFIDTARQLQGKSSLQKAKFFFEHLVKLHLDEGSLITGLLYYPVIEEDLPLDKIQHDQVRELIELLRRFSPTDTVATSSSLFQHRSQLSQNEAVRKMLISLASDPRVVVLKLCERMVALQASNRDSDEAKKIAVELQNFYAPLATRLGIWQLKWPMEDMAFRTLQPEDFKHVRDRLNARRSDREIEIDTLREDLKWRLSLNQITSVIEGRAKSIFGIWRKMRNLQVDFDHIYDMQALRVIVDTVSECYQVLGVVHSSWPHISEEFDDYIASPKSNGYRSLHTAVIGPRGKVLEVQIRTQEMHYQSELGVCAHWLYKGMDKASLSAGKLDWLRDGLNWQEGLFDFSSSNPPEENSENRQIYLTTPQGHVVEMIEGSTPIDFAYRIHTEIGHTCVGALVDGKRSPLNRELRTGQRVEIVTKTGGAPQRIWLQRNRGYVQTSRAREKIETWFRDHAKEQNREAGRDWLISEFKKLQLEFDPNKLIEQNGYSDIDDLFVDVGLGNVLVREIAIRAMREYKVPVGNQWISVIGRDRSNLLLDVSEILSQLGLNIVNISAGTDSKSKKARMEFELSIQSHEDLAMVVDNLSHLDDIEEIMRGRIQDLLDQSEGTSN
ncbi:MAG: HD domain-containing protein [Gammaproteobacteria bacterium]|nr:HD domain-containing protein [Gammaproteobacteria bacterium]